MISHLQMITIYVSDLQRALEFYTETLGFVQTAEFDDGQQRLVWMVPAPASDVAFATEIALFAPGQGDPRIGAVSGIVFTAKDIEATYNELTSRGVQFTMELTRHSYGKGQGDQEARFVDPDGNEPSDQSPITVLPATGEHWPDIETLFAKTPCWCQYWRVSAGEYGRLSKGELLEHKLAERRNALRSQLERPTPPGVIAYIGDRIVGWCGFGPRPEMERLVRSRTIPAVDNRPVWSIVCFLVRTGYRRRGVARALLHGAIECAGSYGAPALEAYPVDPGGKRLDTAFAYVGTLSMFEQAGFRRVMETSARSAGHSRLLVRLELSAPSE